MLILSATSYFFLQATIDVEFSCESKVVFDLSHGAGPIHFSGVLECDYQLEPAVADTTLETDESTLYREANASESDESSENIEELKEPEKKPGKKQKAIVPTANVTLKRKVRINKLH